MSLFSIKDLDYFFLKYLDDSDLLRFIQVNNYYWKLCNENFWRLRFLEKYPLPDLEKHLINVHQERWKKHYFKTRKLYNDKRYAMAIYKTLSEDELDIFLLLIRKCNCNPYNYSTFFEDKTAELTFHPRDVISEKDAIYCYRYLRTDMPAYCLVNLIRYKSDKVLKEVFMSTYNYPTEMILSCFVFDSPMLINLMKSKINYESVIDLFFTHRNNVYPDFSNDTFDLFISQDYFTSEKLYWIKMKALERNRQDIIQLINKHTSYFR